MKIKERVERLIRDGNPNLIALVVEDLRKEAEYYFQAGQDISAMGWEWGMAEAPRYNREGYRLKRLADQIAAMDLSQLLSKLAKL